MAISNPICSERQYSGKLRYERPNYTSFVVFVNVKDYGTQKHIRESKDIATKATIKNRTGVNFYITHFDEERKHPCLYPYGLYISRDCVMHFARIMEKLFREKYRH